jgi:putative Mg2+ transporter-C (MgtC) family protein
MDWMYEVNLYSITLRLVLAVFLGGIIGLERGRNKHQAGLRTHILVCVGATLAMLTNDYIFEEITQLADPARLGAQVISGIGFLGAGLILVTSRNKVKGLTTAAGLWASACTGLALGIGFYSGAIIASILVFLSLSLLPKVEVYFYNHSRIMNLFIEVESIQHVKTFLASLRQQEIIPLETQINQSSAIVEHGYGIYLSIRIPKKISHDQVVQSLADREGILLVEELE